MQIDILQKLIQPNTTELYKNSFLIMASSVRATLTPL